MFLYLNKEIYVSKSLQDRKDFLLIHFFCIISFVPWLFLKQPHRHSCMALKHWEHHASAFQCLLK